MDLHEVEITDLFGEFSFNVPFNVGAPLKFLHGANGSGKTTILRALDALFNRRFHELRSLPFAAIRVKFVDEGDITVRRLQEDRETHLEFTTVSPHPHRWTHRFEDESRKLPYSVIEEIVPGIERIGPGEWATSTGEVLDFDTLSARYNELFPLLEGRSRRVKTPPWLITLLARVHVYFIKAERLSSSQPPAHRSGYGSTARSTHQRPTVLVYAEDLAGKIRQKLADYSNLSQQLDSTFPARFLKRDVSVSPVPSEAEVRARYAGQVKQRERFVAAGLLEPDEALQLPEQDLGEPELRVLDTYLDDVDKKLNQLDDLATKIELFLEIVNGKFRRKKLVIDGKAGFQISVASEDRISLRLLSSGEQQEIVLAYSLLFREQSGTLVLLDEPEISLHVLWQRAFLNDLLKISEVAKLDFLIATHSPQIISDRWDLTFSLDGSHENEDGDEVDD